MEPLIGRGDERRLLRAELGAAAAGRTRVALVGGEPGIGKSSLVAAAAADGRAAAATLDLLCHVAGRRPDLRLLVLGAYRTGEAARSPAFGRALDELNRLRTLRLVDLGPLPEDDVARLAAAHLDGELEPPAVAILA